MMARTRKSQPDPVWHCFRCGEQTSNAVYCDECRRSDEAKEERYIASLPLDEAIAYCKQKARETPDFHQAIGAIPLKEGMPTATEAIRQAREED